MQSEQKSKPTNPRKKPDTPRPQDGERVFRTFEVTGPLVGAVRTTHRQKFVDKNYHRYARFKEALRILANQEQIPRALSSTETASVGLSVRWKKRQRVDIDNLIKSILDGLWSNDRRVTEIRAVAEEHTGEESARITVGWTWQEPMEMGTEMDENQPEIVYP